MTVAAYRDRASGRYPVFVPEIRERAGVLFGDEPPADVLASLGLDPVQAVAVPAHDAIEQMVTEGEPAQTKGAWRQTWVVSDLPPPPPYTISKADIFRRTTEDEAEAITAALSQASARLQGIYAGAQTLNTGDPDFPMVRAGIVAAVGEERADQLLAPST